MSDYVTKLEGYPDLEVSIIRATKINKVLKAILKLENIPKEEDFQCKHRSQVLLDKWNKLLAVDGTPAPAPGAAPAVTNGVNSKPEAAPAKEEAAKAENTEAANGVKPDGKAKADGPKADQPAALAEKKDDAPASKPVSLNGDSP